MPSSSAAAATMDTSSRPPPLRLGVTPIPSAGATPATTPRSSVYTPTSVAESSRGRSVSARSFAVDRRRHRSNSNTRTPAAAVTTASLSINTTGMATTTSTSSTSTTTIKNNTTNNSNSSPNRRRKFEQQESAAKQQPLPPRHLNNTNNSIGENNNEGRLLAPFPADRTHHRAPTAYPDGDDENHNDRYSNHLLPLPTPSESSGALMTSGGGWGSTVSSGSGGGASLSASYVRRLVASVAAASSNNHSQQGDFTISHLNSTRKSNRGEPALETSRQAGEAAAAVLSVQKSGGGSALPMAGGGGPPPPFRLSLLESTTHKSKSSGKNHPVGSANYISSSSSVRSHHTEPPPRSAPSSSTPFPLSPIRQRAQLRLSLANGLDNYDTDHSDGPDNIINNNDDDNNHHKSTVFSTTTAVAAGPEDRSALTRLERIRQRNNNLTIQHIRSFEPPDHDEEDEVARTQPQSQPPPPQSLMSSNPPLASGDGLSTQPSGGISGMLNRHGRIAKSRSPHRQTQRNSVIHSVDNNNNDFGIQKDSSGGGKTKAGTMLSSTTTAVVEVSHHEDETSTLQSTLSAPAHRAQNIAVAATAPQLQQPTTAEPISKGGGTTGSDTATEVAVRRKTTSPRPQPHKPRVAITGADIVDVGEGARVVMRNTNHIQTPQFIYDGDSSNQPVEEETVSLANREDEPYDFPAAKVTTVDEVEPEVNLLNLDAACLEDDLVVRLQPYHVHNLYMCQHNHQQQQPESRSEHNDKNEMKATTPSTTVVTTTMPTQVVLRAVAWSAPVLCYGEYVRLHCTSSTTAATTSTSPDGTSCPSPEEEIDQSNAVVGVLESTNQVCIVQGNDPKRKKSPDTQGNVVMSLWQVFRGDSMWAHVIEIGSFVANPKCRPSPRTMTTSPIHSGDPILLRHVATGGLLSFFAGEWRILTDSYQQEEEPPLPQCIGGGNTGHDDESLLSHNLRESNINKIPLNRLRDHNYIVPSVNEIFTFVLDTVPWTTAWIHGGPLACRKFLVKSYLRFPNRNRDDAPAADVHELLAVADYLRQDQFQSLGGQESLILEELLGAYLGLEGTYLRAKVLDESDSSIQGRRVQFFLDDGGDVTFDRGLRSLVKGLLPLANSFVLVEEFIAKRLPRFEYGSVMQALCACLDGMIQDYSSYIIGIEKHYRKKRTMTLRELQVACHLWMEKLSILEKVVFVVADRKGGSLINGLRYLLIHQYQGNALAEGILRTLLDEASKPFMSMLQMWLANGILVDPYREFMIQCNIGADWDCRYTMDSQNTLQHFFPTPVEADRVLSAGKYWNAVHACHNNNNGSLNSIISTIPPPSTFSLEYHVNGAQVASYIQCLYSSASQALVRLLMEECDLMGTLWLLKRYFLLDQGDFFLNFLDVAEEELARDPSKLRQSRVQHLLQVSVPVAESKNSDNSRISPLQQRLRLSPLNLACRFAPDSLVEEMDRVQHAQGGGWYANGEASIPPHRLVYAAEGQANPTHTGVDLFVLEFTEVPFPLSLILSESILANYRLLFRHLFFAKHVERKLVMVWQDHLSMKEFTSVRGPMGSTYLLRQRMLHCVQNLIYYMMFEVIEPNWLQMIAKISAPSKDKTVDEIMGVHCEFLDHTLEACLLTNRDFVFAFTRVMQTCLLFSKQMETFVQKVRLHQDRREVALANLNRIQQNLHSRGSGGVGTPASGTAAAAKASATTTTNTTTVGEQLAERQQRVMAQTRRLEREVASPEFQRMIVHYESTFTKHLRTFMGVLIQSDDKYHTQKVNLCIRLDYNGYVTSSMGLLRTAR